LYFPDRYDSSTNPQFLFLLLNSKIAAYMPLFGLKKKVLLSSKYIIVPLEAVFLNIIKHQQC
jgi:hypothetical protein